MDAVRTTIRYSDATYTRAYRSGHSKNAVPFLRTLMLSTIKTNHTKKTDRQPTCVYDYARTYAVFIVIPAYGNTTM